MPFTLSTTLSFVSTIFSFASWAFSLTLSIADSVLDSVLSLARSALSSTLSLARSVLFSILSVVVWAAAGPRIHTVPISAATTLVNTFVMARPPERPRLQNQHQRNCETCLHSPGANLVILGASSAADRTRTHVRLLQLRDSGRNGQPRDAATEVLHVSK